MQVNRNYLFSLNSDSNVSNSILDRVTPKFLDFLRCLYIIFLNNSNNFKGIFY